MFVTDRWSPTPKRVLYSINIKIYKLCPCYHQDGLRNKWQMWQSSPYCFLSECKFQGVDELPSTKLHAIFFNRHLICKTRTDKNEEANRHILLASPCESTENLPQNALLIECRDFHLPVSLTRARDGAGGAYCPVPQRSGISETK